jgi:hypothetical protein
LRIRHRKTGAQGIGSAVDLEDPIAARGGQKVRRCQEADFAAQIVPAVALAACDDPPASGR